LQTALARDRKINDLITRIFLAPFVGHDIRVYRENHLRQHRFWGTVKDTEVSYFQHLNLPRFVSTLSGFYLFRPCFATFRSRASVTAKKAIRAGHGDSANHAACRDLGPALSDRSGPAAAICWAVAYFIFSPFLGNLRQTLEHRSFDADPQIDYRRVAHGETLRNFGTGFFARYFGACGFNRHMFHHWDPSISYTRFDLMEMLNLIEHVENPKQLLRDTLAVLNPGGRILIKTPNTDTIDRRLFANSYWGGLHAPRHWVLFNKHNFKSAVREAGFKLTSLRYTQGAPQWTMSVLGSMVISKWLKKPARPLGLHFLNAPLMALFAAIDFIRAPLMPTAQMVAILEAPKE